MAHRDWGQLGFADHMAMRHGRPNELLTRVAELIDWAALARIVSVLHDSPHGAPAYPPLAMVKALLLLIAEPLSTPTWPCSRNNACRPSWPIALRDRAGC